MKFGLYLCLINAMIFIVYGLCFLIIPSEIAVYVTETSPTTASGLVDMRATYGGMSIAIGVVLAFLSLNKKTLGLGVIILLIFMLLMALGRLLGIVLDGDANNKMYYYLVSEVIIALVCGVWLKVVNINYNKI